MGIDFTEVSPNPEVTFEDCVLRYASFVGLSLRKTAFLRCSALEANFSIVAYSAERHVNRRACE